MKILAISRNIEGAVQEMNFGLFEQEIKDVWQLYAEGFIREFYAKANEHGVVLVLECENTDEAQKRLQELPFVSSGIIEFEYIPIEHFSLLSILFKEKQ